MVQFSEGSVKFHEKQLANWNKTNRATQLGCNIKNVPSSTERKLEIVVMILLCFVLAVQCCRHSVAINNSQ